MLIILISLVLLAISGLGWFIAEKRYKCYEDLQYKYQQKQYQYPPCTPGCREAEENEERCRIKRNHWGAWSVGLFICFVIGVTAVFICCLVMLNHCTVEADKVRFEETYAALQDAETGVFPHDCSISEMRVEYNKKIRNHRRWNDNIWINWFIPDFYDGLPLFHSPNT